MRFAQMLAHVPLPLHQHSMAVAGAVMFRDPMAARVLDDMRAKTVA